MRGEGATEGVAAAAEALRRAQVKTLLLSADMGKEPWIWGSPSDPLEVSVDRESLSVPETAIQAPASALLLRAAAYTDAEFVELADSSAAEGVGTILRYTTGR